MPRITLLWLVLSSVGIFAAATLNCRSDFPGNICYDRDTLELTLDFRNNGQFQGACTEVLRVADFAGNSDAPQINELELTPNTRRNHRLVVRDSSGGGRTFQVIYSLLQEGRVLFQKSFTGAIYPRVTAIAPKESRIGMYCHSIEIPAETNLMVLKGMGFSWLRTDFGWKTVQPNPGEWRWQVTDKRMAAVNKYGMFITYNLLYSPSWAVDKRNAYGGAPRDYQEFAEFAARACARYPEVTYWSIWNEPDAESHWGGGAKEFAKCLAVVAPAMRKANPKVKILPGGVTGLLQMSAPFMRELGRLGAGEYFDVYDFHYTGLEEHKKISAEMGWEKPLWNTELSGGIKSAPHHLPRYIVHGLANGLERVFIFLCSIKIRNQDHLNEFGRTRMLDNAGCPTFNYPLIYTISKHLNGISQVEDLSAGSQKLYRLTGKAPAVESLCLWQEAPQRRTMAIATQVPLQVTLADSTQLHLTPVNGEVHLPADDTLFIQNEDGTPLSRQLLPQDRPGLAWIIPLTSTPFYGQELTLPVQLNNSSNQPFTGQISLLLPGDWQGASQQQITLAPGEKRQLHFKVTPRKLMDFAAARIILEVRDAAGKLCAFDRLDTELTSPLQFTLSPAFHWGEKKVLAAVENRTAAPMDGVMAFSNSKRNYKMPFQAAPMTTTRLYFAPGEVGDNTEVTATLTSQGGTSQVKAALTWQGIPSKEQLKGARNIILNQRSQVTSSSNILYQWMGAEDLSVAASLYWEPEAVVLEAEVTDDLHSEAANTGTLWSRDSLQMYFNGSIYDFALFRGKGVFHCNGQLIVEPRFQVQRQGTVTTYRIAFPKPGGGKWRSNDTVTLAFIVNDADQAQRKGWMVYGNDIGVPRKRKNTLPSTLMP